MLKTVGRTTDVAPGEGRAFGLREGGAGAGGRSRIPLLRAIGIGRSSRMRIALANVGGTVYAIDDTCTHQTCSLGDGRLEGSGVRGACHGSRFDVTTGAVVEGPGPTTLRSHPPP